MYTGPYAYEAAPYVYETFSCLGTNTDAFSLAKPSFFFVAEITPEKKDAWRTLGARRTLVREDARARGRSIKNRTLGGSALRRTNSSPADMMQQSTNFLFSYSATPWARQQGVDCSLASSAAGQRGTTAPIDVRCTSATRMLDFVIFFSTT